MTAQNATMAPASVAIAEADGEILAWAVAQCEGLKTYPYLLSNGWQRFEPHRNPNQAHAVIRRAQIDLVIDEAADPAVQHVAIRRGPAGRTVSRGPTPWVAAMRCRVASELGERIQLRP